MLRVSLHTCTLSLAHSRGTRASKERRCIIKKTQLYSRLRIKYRAYRDTSARSGDRRNSPFSNLFIGSLGDDKLQPLTANSLGSGKSIPGSIRNTAPPFSRLSSRQSREQCTSLDASCPSDDFSPFLSCCSKDPGCVRLLRLLLHRRPSSIFGLERLLLVLQTRGGK